MRAWRCRLAADVRGGMDATLYNQNKKNKKNRIKRKRFAKSVRISILQSLEQGAI